MTSRFTDNIQSSILNNVIGVNSISEGQKLGIENFLIKNESNLRYFMQVLRNESLVQEKKEKLKQGSESLAKNVIVIYIDALSRAHAHRKINRTLKWFEEANSERSSFEFFRYHSGAPFTFPNAFKFLYGHYYTKMEKNMRKSNTGEKYKSFLQIYQEQGFVVGHATDFCSAYSVSNNPEYENIFDFTPNDHENYVQACDLNYEKQNSEWDLTQGPYSPLPRCLYGKNVFEYILEYGEQFLEAYKDEKKLLFMEFMDAHVFQCNCNYFEKEGTGEVISQMDNRLNDFLQNLEKKKMLEDSVVLLFADHGLHMQGPLYILKLDGVNNEIALPAMFLSLPKSLDSQLLKNVKNNEQKLVHAENIFNFFMQILNGNATEANVKEYSLLGDLPIRADCQDAFQWDIEMFCACNYA